MSTKKISLLLSVSLAALMLVACGGKEKKADEESEKDIPVVAEPVVTAEVATILSYGADLMPSAKVRLLSLLTDTVLSYPWQEGDEILKGQVVAVIRRDGLNQGLAQMDAQAAALEVQIANLKSELARTRDLFAKGVATQQVVDQLTAQHDAAVAQKNALLAGKRQLAVAAGNAVVKAPVDGVLSSKAYEEGDVAAPQLPLGILLVTDPLKVELKLIEKDIALVKPGQEVELRLDAYPGRVFIGTVTRVFPYVDAATRTNTVEVSLPNPRGEDGLRELKPGMYGVASLVVERRQDVVMAPEGALLIDNQLLAQQKPGEVLRRAFVVDGQGIARERVLRLGARNGTKWEILDGVNAGESIVVRGQHGLAEGKKVKLIVDVKAQPAPVEPENAPVAAPATAPDAAPAAAPEAAPAAAPEAASK